MSWIAVGCVFAAMSGQVVKPAPIYEEELEKRSDPPALFKAMSFSPRLLVPFGNFTSYQVNVNSNQQNIVGDAANEPSICVDPTNPNRIAIGWRQFDNVSSNFRQSGYAYTTDGGLTWTFPGKLENNVFRSDPVLAAKFDGTFYYLSLLETFFDDLWSSSNGGSNWTRIAGATGGDKQWFTVDNGTSSGRGFLYQLWSTAGNNYQGRQFSRSTNGGATWMDPINIPSQPIWGTLDVDAAGTLFMGGWSNSLNGFRAVRSQNARNPAVTPTFDLTSTINLGGGIPFGAPVNPGGLSGQLWMAVDRSTVAPNPVYALCSIQINATNPCDVMISRSMNSASSWQPAVRVNDDPLNTTNYHWFGALGVGPTGRLDVAWNDTRNDPSDATSSLYYAYSLDQGQHFSANIRVSPSFNQSLGYPNQNKMGDYIGVVSNSVGANIAYTATFNGEQDVYFLQIPSVVVVAPNLLTSNADGFPGPFSSLAAVDGNVITTTSSSSQDSGVTPELTIEGTSPSFSPKALLFNLVQRGQFANDTISLRMFNWNTNAFEVVGGTTTALTNGFYNVLTSGDISRFVQPATGKLRARLKLTHTGPLTTKTWKVFIDQAVWHVIP